MGAQDATEKREGEHEGTRTKSRGSAMGRGTIVVLQHALLWILLYVMASTIYIMIIGAVSMKDLASAVLYIVASTLSLCYLILQNATTHLRVRARNMSQNRTVDGYQGLAKQTSSILIMVWMLSSVAGITLTAIEAPLCSPKANSAGRPLDHGTTCVLSRVTVLASLVAIGITGLLYILLNTVHEPFRSHLFGIVHEHRLLLPLYLPTTHATRHPMYSELSFKCRSSTSLTSQTMVPPGNDSFTHLINSEAELAKPCGLGIYTQRASAPPSLLRPRPSLVSIRSHTSLSLPPPPASPLPPLPAYIPNKYRMPKVLLKDSHPPRRPHRSDDSVRLIEPSPALNKDNLAVLNRSNVSLSSVYSRSTSGESRPNIRPNTLSVSSRTTSSSSMTTLKRSPLGAMTLADDPADIPLPTFSGGAINGLENVKPLDLHKCHSARVSKLDERLKGYVESQNRIRESSLKLLMLQNGKGLGTKIDSV